MHSLTCQAKAACLKQIKFSSPTPNSVGPHKWFERIHNWRKSVGLQTFSGRRGFYIFGLVQNVFSGERGDFWLVLGQLPTLPCTWPLPGLPASPHLPSTAPQEALKGPSRGFCMESPHCGNIAGMIPDLPKPSEEKGVKATSPESLLSRAEGSTQDVGHCSGIKHQMCSSGSSSWLPPCNKHWFTLPGGHRMALTPVQPPELPGLLQRTIHPCRPVLSPENPFPAEKLGLRGFCSASFYSLDHPSWIPTIWQQSNAKLLLGCVHVHPWRHRAGHVAPQPHTRAQLPQTPAWLRETSFQAHLGGDHSSSAPSSIISWDNKAQSYRNPAPCTKEEQFWCGSSQAFHC